MSIFASLYLKASGNKFRKSFKPLGIKQKRQFLISLPHTIDDFLTTLPLLEGLKRLGTLVVLMPENLTSIYTCMNSDMFEVVFCAKPIVVLSREYERLKKRFSERHFHFLIELDKPANKSLPYIAPIEKRICFYEEGNYPYYNIMVRDSITTLSEFFNLKDSNPQKLFYVSPHDAKELLQKYEKKRPVLFVNGADTITWGGDRIVVGQHIAASDPDIYKVLSISDAYCGKNDTLYRFANFLNKEILEL